MAQNKKKEIPEAAVEADFYSAKQHLQDKVRLIGTLNSTAKPADAAPDDKKVIPQAEIITHEKLLAALAASGRKYDMNLIERAYETADRLHAGVRRRSGEPYICHPLAVARLLVDLGMDSESIAAALLHDVVEDTPFTIEEVRDAFGPGVALLVDGVTKLTKIQFSTREEQQSENLRKMLLAMIKDVRVMIIKLCDRLHNMRTGDAWPEQKRRDKARETMEIYAPIANRMGILNIKEELEDRSLHYLDPVAYDEICQLLSERNGEEFLSRVSSSISNRLAEQQMNHFTMKRRVKSVYGIYRKMYQQHKNFDEIYDVYAVRVIVDTVGECYNALGLIHDMYHPIPNRFKDYISNQKPNGYKSLHTTVIGHEGVPFEVQIRTYDMDEMAEYGVAAHWRYKEGIEGPQTSLDDKLAWVRQLLDNQQIADDDGQLLVDLKSELLPEEVFAFTPKGDVHNLPAGANCIDFAYAIHSAVGHRMVGCKVNNHMVPIDTKVNTGDIIEIITGPADKGPSRDWLKIVKTSEARSKIRNWFKKMCKDENIEEGRTMLMREMRRDQLYLKENEVSDFMLNVAHRMRKNTADEMFASIGYGGLTMLSCMPRVREEYAKLRENNETKPLEEIEHFETQHAVDGVVVDGMDNCPIKFAKCCSPLPGDDIVGFVTRGYGVSIHKRTCANAINGMRDTSNAGRWVNAHWQLEASQNFKATLELTALDRDGLMMDVAGALKDMHVPIYAINAPQAEKGRAIMNLTVGITNTEHLKRVMTRLGKIKDITNVTRG